MAEAAALSAGGKVAGCLIEPIQRELGYLLCFNNSIQELETRLDQLKAMTKDVQAREDEAKRSWKTLGEAANLWMVEANAKITEAETVISDKTELQRGCFSIKWCPNLRLRFSLGRKGKKLSLVLIDLLQSGRNYLLQTVLALPLPPINMRDYNGDASHFGSRRKVMEEIIEMLHDKETRLIGICGMGGIGKTTFAKQVLQKVQDFHKHLFDFQVISTVSSNPSFKNIQQEVVEMLGGSSLKEIVSEYARAEHLRNTFKNKKVVVLLDDVWEEFDLNAMGFPLSNSDVEGCCKIIYTSRKNDLWSDERTITKQNISLELLSAEEALNLFGKIVCLDYHDDEFQLKKEIESEIVKECGRLPLALKVVGGALFEKRIHEWKDMLYSLQNQHQVPQIDKINRVLETSYDFLRDPDLKLLFLLCCLFREDQEIPIETLYRYAAGLQLFKSINGLEHVRDRVYSLVDNLIRRNLIVNVKAFVFSYPYGERERSVKLHDVVRDVGISIGKRHENGFSFQTCHSVNDLGDNDFSEHTKIISILFQYKDLLVSDMAKVPNMMEFRGSKLELKLLRLEMGDKFRIDMLNDFFHGIDYLKVLIIEDESSIRTSLSNLSSFSYLANLKMLCLESLVLNDLFIIRHLSCLEILSLRGSLLKVLPKEISELTNLRMLDLFGCNCFVSKGVLSKLTTLQELYMSYLFDWSVPNEDNLLSTTDEDNDDVAAELIELNHLNKLWRLEFHVSNIRQVPRGVILLPSSKLLKFKIKIGRESSKLIRDSIFESGERVIWLSNVDDKVFHAFGTIMENKCTDIVVTDCESIITLPPLIQSSSATSDIELEGHFRRIEIYRCNQMKYLNNCSEVKGPEKMEFNDLETLKLYDLCRLECFYKGIYEIYFHTLKTLELVRLEQFILSTKLELPRLEKLIIESIPNLNNLCNFFAPSLKELRICDCPHLKYVFSSASSSLINNISHLSSLHVERCLSLKGILSVSFRPGENWNESFRFDKLWRLHLDSLPELTSFIIDEKEKSQSPLFYHDQVAFPCLIELKILDLPEINYIVVWNGLQEQPHANDNDNQRKLQQHIPLFPILKILWLGGLPNLIHIYESNHSELGVLLFQNLSELSIFRCEKLRYLFSENIGRDAAKHLEILEIFTCPILEVVMKNDDDNTGGGGESISVPINHFFPLLKKLELVRLPELKRFCDVAYTWDLPLLKRLDVVSCLKLKTLSPGCLNSPKLESLQYNGRLYNVATRDINNTLRRLFKREYGDGDGL